MRLVSTGEIGVIVHSWENQELGATDYHVAFYGAEFPIGKPEEPPYVLRYLDSSLESIEE